MKELEYFARDPTKAGEHFTIASLVEFNVFDENSIFLCITFIKL